MCPSPAAHAKPRLPPVAAAVACLAAALAATPCGVPRPRASSATAAAASPPPFSALWPARVALSLYATIFMAAQPLALDTPARALLPPSATAWLTSGGGCRLHGALALGVGWPALTLTAAAVLAAPLSAAPARRAVSPIRGGKEVPTAAPLTAGPAIAVGALAALPALAAQTALAFAPHPPPASGWRDTWLAVCAGGAPAPGGVRCACAYSGGQLAALAATSVFAAIALARAAGAAAAASLNRRLNRRLRLMQSIGAITMLLYAAAAGGARVVVRSCGGSDWHAAAARAATTAVGAISVGLIVGLLVVAPTAAARARRQGGERV